MGKERAQGRAAAILGAALFALLAAFGHEAERMMRDDPLGQSSLPRIAATALALFALLCAALFALRAAASRRPRREPAGRALAEPPFRAGRAFGMILLCYVPIFIAFFPGSFAYDVPFQLRQALTGEYSTHHPLLHTLFLGACVSLGRALGHVNLGAALYTACQAAGLAGCFALTCASIARRCGARAARTAALFFGLYPLHMVFAVNATKDVLFSGLFALALALFLEAADMGLARRGIAGLVLCTSLMLSLRNNAAYALAVWVLALPPLLGRRGLSLAGAALLSLAVSLGAGGLLARALSAEPGDLCEMLSWPIQQLARARATQGDRLDEEEKRVVDMLMPGEAWRLYDPMISDPVKFEFDTGALLEDPARCARVYLSIGKKCPHVYLDALLLHTYSFLYPYGTYRVPGAYVQMTVSERYYDGWWTGERIESAFPRLVAALQWRFGSKGAMQFPIIGLFFNTGVAVWAMLLLSLRALYAGRRGAFAVSLLPVLLWGTFLLGPVMAGRYAYPFVCALPVLACRTRSRLADGEHANDEEGNA